MSKQLTFAISFIAILGLSSFSGDKAADSKVQWMTFEEAIEANKDNPRKIFVDIYTDWCGWCKKMDAQTFNHPDIASYMNDNYYNVKFNAEQKGEVVFNGHELLFCHWGHT